MRATVAYELGDAELESRALRLLGCGIGFGDPDTLVLGVDHNDSYVLAAHQAGPLDFCQRKLQVVNATGKSGGHGKDGKKAQKEDFHRVTSKPYAAMCQCRDFGMARSFALSH